MIVSPGRVVLIKVTQIIRVLRTEVSVTRSIQPEAKKINIQKGMNKKAGSLWYHFNFLILLIDRCFNPIPPDGFVHQANRDYQERNPGKKRKFRPCVISAIEKIMSQIVEAQP